LEAYEGSLEIIGRYFRNWGSGIDGEQFAWRMRPKDMLEEVECSGEGEGELVVNFVKMMRTVIEVFGGLEVLRRELSAHCDCFVEYFYRKYGYARSLNK
jgi:hypothetical protein